MSDYKCVRSFIYAEHHEAFEYGQEISTSKYQQLSTKGKMNFERKYEAYNSSSGLHDSYTPPPAPMDFGTSSSSSSSWDSGSSSDSSSSSSFDFGGGDGGGGGSTGDW